MGSDGKLGHDLRLHAHRPARTAMCASRRRPRICRTAEPMSWSLRIRSARRSSFPGNSRWTEAWKEAKATARTTKARLAKLAAYSAGEPGLRHIAVSLHLLQRHLDDRRLQRVRSARSTCTWRPGPTTDGSRRCPGLQGNEAYETARKTCSESMNLCADHSETNFASFRQEGAPYIFNANGEKQGRLPTNVGIVPGGTTFPRRPAALRRLQPFRLLVERLRNPSPTAKAGRRLRTGGADRGARFGVRQRHRQTHREDHLQMAGRRADHARRRKSPPSSGASTSRACRLTGRMC